MMVTQPQADGSGRGARRQNSSAPATCPIGKTWRVAAQMVSSRPVAVTGSSACGCGAHPSRRAAALHLAETGAITLLGPRELRLAASGWITPGILEALIPGRMQGHGSTEEVPGRAA